MLNLSRHIYKSSIKEPVWIANESKQNGGCTFSFKACVIGR